MSLFSPNVAQTFILSDGRTLGFADYGDIRGMPLLYLHGGGSSRLEPAYAHDFAIRYGIRVIATDRPGYGMSSPLTAYSFEAVARDVLELADALKLDRFSVAGMSAGTPYALHLAVAAPERVRLVSLINPSPDTLHDAWKISPLSSRLLIKLSRMPGLLTYSARKLKADPKKVASRIARRQGWSATTLGQFSAMIEEGMKQEGSLATLLREARMVLAQSWHLDWGRVPCPILAICGISDQAAAFYREMSERDPNISFMQIPGPHMPIVSSIAWDRIGSVMRARS